MITVNVVDNVALINWQRSEIEVKFIVHAYIYMYVIEACVSFCKSKMILQYIAKTYVFVLNTTIRISRWMTGRFIALRIFQPGTPTKSIVVCVKFVFGINPEIFYLFELTWMFIYWRGHCKTFGCNWISGNLFILTFYPIGDA